MNPRLIKFAVELQNSEKIEVKKKKIKFLCLDYKPFFKILKPEKVTIISDK